MDLLLRMHRPIAQADIGDIVDVAIIHPRRVRTRDDVDVVAHRHFRNVVAQPRGVFGEPFDRLDGRELLFLKTQQHQREQLREDDEVRFVIAGDIDEILHRAHELVIIGDLARLQLAGSNAHRFHPAREPLLHRLVAFDIGVAPDHHHGVRHRGFVLGQVTIHDAFGFEPVGQLEAQHRIVQFPLDDLVEIIFRPVDPAAETAVVRHAARKDDAGEVLLFRQGPALFVETPADADTAHLRVHAHLIAIEPVAGRIVAAAVAVAGDLVPVVRLKSQRFGELHGGAIADHLVIEQRDEAAFLEIVDLPADLAMRIGRHVLVNPAYQMRDPGDVLDHRVADLEPALAEFLGALAFGYALLLWRSGHAFPVFCGSRYDKTGTGATPIPVSSVTA